jgi:hypothetical protein
LYREGFRLSEMRDKYLFGGVAFLFGVAHLFLWMVPIQFSEDTDDHFINEYRKRVEELCGFKPEGPPRGIVRDIYKGLRAGGISWIVAETAITFFLLIIVFIVLS